MRIVFETDGRKGCIDVPFSCDAIRFEQFCDFRTDEQAYFESNDLEGVEKLSYLEKAVGQIVSGDLHLLPFAFQGDVELIESGYTIDLKSDLSLLRLYAHLLTLIRSYKPDSIPDTCQFFHKGKEYTVNSKEAARILLDRPLTTGEALETLEYQRRAAERMKETPKEIGNMDFNLGLTELAILLRQPNERLPHDRQRRERFINERKELFKDIKLSDVLDLRFFLTNSLISYAMTPGLFSSGKVRRVLPVAKEATTNGIWRQWRKRLGM